MTGGTGWDLMPVCGFNPVILTGCGDVNPATSQSPGFLFLSGWHLLLRNVGSRKIRCMPKRERGGLPSEYGACLHRSAFPLLVHTFPKEEIPNTVYS